MMSVLRLRTLSLVCAAVFVFGVASHTVFSFQQSQKVQIEPARAFKLVEIESDVDPSGVETFKAIRTKDVDANGDWNEAVHPIGKVAHVQYSRTAEGVTASNGKESFTIPQEPRSSAVREKTRTIEFYQTNRAFAGTDMVAGLKVYRLRTKLDNEEEGWLETAYSPTTGIMPSAQFFTGPTVRKRESIRLGSRFSNVQATEKGFARHKSKPGALPRRV